MRIRHTLLHTLLWALPIAAVAPLAAQEANPPEPAETAAPAATTPAPPAPMAPAAPAGPAHAGWHRFDEPDPVAHPALPMTVTIPAGTWVSLRLDQELSSDHSRPGDAWTATLTQPVIVNGRVVAQRGQTVGGSVADAVRAGRAKGTSHLGVELNEITLADGRQVPVRARLMEFTGQTSKGRDLAAAGTTIGTGAAIGAAVNGGVGAGVGAAAGVVASTVGILLTRGRPTVLYPETVLTFRVEAPISFVIDNPTSLRAFAPVQPTDYQPKHTAALVQRAPAPRPVVYDYPPYWYSPYWYGPSWYSPYWGPSIGFTYIGGGWGHHGDWGHHGGWGHYHGGGPHGHR